MFERIGKLIQKNIQANPKIFLAPKICYWAEKIILKLMPNTKTKFTVISFTKGRLKIASIDPTINYQIKLNESEIIERIKKKTGYKKPIKLVYSPKES